MPRRCLRLQNHSFCNLMNTFEMLILQTVNRATRRLMIRETVNREHFDIFNSKCETSVVNINYFDIWSKLNKGCKMKSSILKCPL